MEEQWAGLHPHMQLHAVLGTLSSHWKSLHPSRCCGGHVTRHRPLLLLTSLQECPLSTLYTHGGPATSF